MHHYRSREDDNMPQSNVGGGGGGDDPYFYLRLSAGAASSYNNPVKLEVDVKPESHMTPVVCGGGLQQQQQSSMAASSSPSETTMVMNIAGDEVDVICKDEHDGTNGLGLLALTQLDGYGGYKSLPPQYCNAATAIGGGTEDVISSTGLLDNRIDDDKTEDNCKYSYGRLIYSSSDDIKHQVFEYIYIYVSSCIYYIIVAPPLRAITFFSLLLSFFRAYANAFIIIDPIK